MNKPNTTVQVIAAGLVALSAIFHDAILAADQQIITDDGREVLLWEDGSWQFLSDDRFATTTDGRRVRLKQNGSWEYLDNAAKSSMGQAHLADLEITIQQVVVETHETKVHKNKRVTSQTVFYLSLQASSGAERTISMTAENKSLIEVKDNTGRNYPLLSVKPDQAEIEPAKATTIVLRADGSPQWWKNVKSMEVTFKRGLFGLRETVSLSKDTGEFVSKKVTGFD